MRSVALVVLGFVGCGGWSVIDTAGAADALQLDRQVEQACSAGVDAGQCVPAQVRALERANACIQASMLARHGVTVSDDAGALARCQP